MAVHFLVQLSGCTWNAIAACTKVAMVARRGTQHGLTTKRLPVCPGGNAVALPRTIYSSQFRQRSIDRRGVSPSRMNGR